MPRTLYFRPVLPEPMSTPLSDDLRDMLAMRFALTNQVMRVGPDQIAYLEGLADAGIDGANLLVSAIREHGMIELFPV